MTDVNPIGNQEDILREANANASQTTTNLSNQQNITTLDAENNPVISEDPAQSSSEQKTYPHAMRPIEEAASKITGLEKFSYRLPVSSYVLISLNVLVVFFSTKAFIMLGFSLNSSYFHFISATTIYCIAAYAIVAFSLLQGTRFFRYVAIITSVIFIFTIIFPIQSVGNIIESKVNVGYVISTYSMSLIDYPAHLLPFITIGYLLSPIAKRAYK